jgi:SAM-dependent methyltransferase
MVSFSKLNFRILNSRSMNINPNVTPSNVSIDEIREITLRNVEEIRYNIVKSVNHEVHTIALRKVYFSDDFGDSRYFARKLPEFVHGRFLEIGCGTGVVLIAVVLESSPNSDNHRHVAIDINPFAVMCTKINAQINEVDDKLDIRRGDVFSSLKDGEKFDCIFWNHPFHKGYPEEDIVMRACFDPLFSGFREYVKNGFNYLYQNGRLLLGSGNFADLDDMREILSEYECEMILLDYIHRPFEVTSGELKTFNIYEIRKTN